jgi:uncharacterized membrane protein YtjA (UPF0391 family)
VILFCASLIDSMFGIGPISGIAASWLRYLPIEYSQ